ncbi:Patched domain-containing protein 3, partial [Branchiostoma belcheri]
EHGRLSQVQTVDDVSKFLQVHNFAEYIEAFQDQEVDGDALRCLDAAVMRELIPKAGPRAKFKDILRQQRRVQATSEPGVARLIFREIPRKNLKLGKLLGRGQFGEVRLGEVRKRGVSTTVAVKTLHASASDKDKKDLMGELEILVTVGRHDNVISLVGACTIDSPLCVVVEYAPNGSLKDWLKANSPERIRQESAAGYYNIEDPQLPSPPMEQLIQFGIDVAAGMSHLAAMQLRCDDKLLGESSGGQADFPSAEKQSGQNCAAVQDPPPTPAPRLAGHEVRTPCLPNYQGGKIEVPTKLHIPLWRHLLGGYQDNALCDLMRPGEGISTFAAHRVHDDMIAKWIDAAAGRVYYRWGKTVAKWPAPFILLPLVASGLLGYFGLIGLVLDEEFSFVPDNGKTLPAMQELEHVGFFPSGDAMSEIIVQAKDGGDTLFGDGVVEEVLRLHRELTTANTASGDTFAALCFRDPATTECVLSGILQLMITAGSGPALRAMNLTYPYHNPNRVNNNLGTYFGRDLGGVEVSQDGSTILSSKALHLVYDVQANLSQWTVTFRQVCSEFESEKITVDYIILGWHHEETGTLPARVSPYVAAAMGLLILFSVVSCMMLDWVLTKPWLAVTGVLSAALSIVSSIGVLPLAGVSFHSLNAAIPFLLLGIGVDDMFVMIAAWRKCDVRLPVEERMGRAMSDAGVSITITSLTDCLAFTSGITSVFPAVRIFCTYAAVGVAFDFLYQITFFAAFMSLTGRRERANRHCLTCRPVLPQSQARHKSATYRLCCAAGVSRQEGAFDNPSSKEFNQDPEYWKTEVQQAVLDKLKAFDHSQYFYDTSDTAEVWLRDYLRFLNRTENYTGISASRFFVIPKDVPTTTSVRGAAMMAEARRIAEGEPFIMRAFSIDFFLSDQLALIPPSALQTAGIAVAIMFAVCFLFIPHCVAAFLTTFALVSIIAGLVGYMTLWGINLDLISVIAIVMCTGFSVDFFAHITHAYVTSKAATPEEKLTDAVRAVGMPMLQSSLSTILGMLVLAFFPAYIFQALFKTVFLVMVLGVAHGLVILPILLTTLTGLCGQGNVKEQTTVKKNIKTLAMPNGGIPRPFYQRPHSTSSSMLRRAPKLYVMKPDSSLPNLRPRVWQDNPYFTPAMREWIKWAGRQKSGVDNPNMEPDNPGA